MLRASKESEKCQTLVKAAGLGNQKQRYLGGSVSSSVSCSCRYWVSVYSVIVFLSELLTAEKIGWEMREWEKCPLLPALEIIPSQLCWTFI